MKFARRVHSNTTLKGGEGRMEIEYLKKKTKLNYVQVSQLFLSKIVGSDIDVKNMCQRKGLAICCLFSLIVQSLRFMNNLM